jgi:hypothetical protein
LPYATGSAGLAITVRGSSRRIMIMRFRPANIRLINRRLKLLRLLLALSSRKRKDNYKNISTDFAELTRSLHIRGNAIIDSGLRVRNSISNENRRWRRQSLSLKPEFVYGSLRLMRTNPLRWRLVGRTT